MDEGAYIFTAFAPIKLKARDSWEPRAFIVCFSLWVTSNTAP